MAQNKGLRAWLTNELAQAHGCAASLDLAAPLTFATALGRALVPNARAPDGRHPFDAGPLAWRLAPVLDNLGDDPVYDPLRAYLAGTGGQTMPLATRLAELFDDYQVYRPDVLAAWAEGATTRPASATAGGRPRCGDGSRPDAPCLDRAAGLLALADTLRQSGTEAVRDRLPSGWRSSAGCSGPAALLARARRGRAPRAGDGLRRDGRGRRPTPAATRSCARSRAAHRRLLDRPR